MMRFFTAPFHISRGISAGVKSSHPRGFTLIELLIVLFIISIVTSTALLTIRHNENKQLEAVAQEICGNLRLAEEQAMLMPAVIGLSFDGQTFQFLEYVAGDESKTKKIKKPMWVSYDDNVLTNFTLPDGVTVELKIKNTQQETKNDSKKEDESTLKPGIIISTNGDITPFTMSVAAAGKKPMFIINGNDNGDIHYQTLD